MDHLKIENIDSKWAKIFNEIGVIIVHLILNKTIFIRNLLNLEAKEIYWL